MEKALVIGFCCLLFALFAPELSILVLSFLDCGLPLNGHYTGPFAKLRQDLSSGAAPSGGAYFLHRLNTFFQPPARYRAGGGCGKIPLMAAEPRISSRQALRVPPQHIEAEKALLGSIMIKPDSMNDVIDIITPSSFYVEKHRLAYQAMLDLFSKSEPIDLLSLSSKLEEQKKLEQVGGRSFLAELVNTALRQVTLSTTHISSSERV